MEKSCVRLFLTPRSDIGPAPYLAESKTGVPMKKYLFAISVTASAIIGAAPAMAQSDLGGVRLEARAGYDRVDLKISDGFDTAKGHDEALAYGFEAGYDYDFGSGIVGPYANLDFSGTKRCSEIYGLDKGCIKAKHSWGLGVRAGWKAHPSTVLYGKLGYVNGKVAVTYEDYEDILPDFSVSDTRGGIQFGVGGEVTLAGGAYVKLEYVRSNFDKYSDPEVGSVDFSRDQIMTGVGVRF